MNKNEQEQINKRCLMFVDMAWLDFARWHSDYFEFDRSTAAFIKTKDYIVLWSFDRIAALYRISSATAIDILRYKLGYKTGSILHVEKFFKLMDVLFGTVETLCYQRIPNNKKENKK